MGKNHINDTLKIRIKKDMDEEEYLYLFNLAYALDKGLFCEQDEDTAIKLYKICAEQSDNDAQSKCDALNNIGQIYLIRKEPDVDKSIEYLKEAADLGSIEAMIDLGNIYSGGYVYVKAGDCRLDNITCEPGVMLWGTQMPDVSKYKDEKLAVHWMKKAADLGSLKGLFNYANMIHNGIGVRKNYKKALSLWQEISKNDSQAFFFLGLYHEKGFGTKKDYKKAYHYYTLGALKRDPFCYNQLGVLYGKGLGVDKNIEKAMSCYMGAAKLGDVLAHTNIGWLYQHELSNLEQAEEWYRKAACSGEEHAIEALRGLGYEN